MTKYWLASPQDITRAGTEYMGTVKYMMKHYPFGCKVEVRFLSEDGARAHITFPNKTHRLIEHKFISVRPEEYTPETPKPKQIPNGGIRLIRG